MIRNHVLTFTLCLLAAASTLCAQSEEFGGRQSLFNGKDLSGWEVVRGPQKGKTPERWSAEDGILTNGKGHVDDICTTGKFGNYELEIEYRIPERGNSGIYLRGAIEVQIADTYGVEQKNLKRGHAGGIYNSAAPLANPQKKPGEWNLFKIRHIGHRITVWHNGALVQDNVYKPDNTPGCHADYQGAPEKGPVMLQGNHTTVFYRNIRIRPLCTGPGWKPIWNGKDLSAFTGHGPKIEDIWKIDNNALTNSKAPGGRDMWTKEEFGDFLVHYEYKSDPGIHGGNSGFYLRNQWEIQIHGSASTGNKHGDGALYSLYPPARKARHGKNNWNHMDVKVQGMKIWVWQNGVLIHDGITCKTRTDNHGVKTDKWSRGPFKFQGDHGKVWFTNLFIKEMPKK